jgi:tetratricopeptide (TPR) repeat protein
MGQKLKTIAALFRRLTASREGSLVGEGPASVEFPEALIASIQTGSTVVFCGAGISLHSGIPLVGQLLPYVLDKLAVPPQAVFDHNGELQVPFEALVAILMGGSRTERLLDIFGKEDPSEDFLKPNLNHIFLARLARAGHLQTIVTTNFDRLIERAFEAETLRLGKDYLVYHDDEGFSKIDWTDARPRLIKLHGSVEDRNGLAITFKMVERQGLSTPSVEVIREVFSSGKHSDVLMLGYSCSDRFDITPQILMCSADPKNVFCVEHSSRPAVEPISRKGNVNPFKLFEKGTRIFCHTDDLIRELWEGVLHDYQQGFRQSESRWQQCADEWYATVEKPFQHLMAGEMLESAAQFDHAVQRYEAALVHTRQTRDAELESDALSLMASARKSLGQFSLASNLLEQSLTIARTLNDADRIRGIEYQLRSMPSLKGSQQDLSDLETALSQARQRQNKREEGSLLIEMGNARVMAKQYDEALNYFEQAMLALWGDAEAAAVIHNNLGMVHARLGKPKAALFFYFASRGMSRQLGDRRGEGTTEFLLGDLYAEMGEGEKAVQAFERSTAIAEAIGDTTMKATSQVGLERVRLSSGTSSDSSRAASSLLNALAHQDLALNPEIHRLNEEAKISYMLGRDDLGQRQLQQAMESALLLGDLGGQILTLNNMGIAAVGLNNPAAGIQAHEKALALSRQIDDRDLEVTALNHLAKLVWHAGQPLDVVRYYEESIQRAKEMDRPDKQIDYLNLLARAYFNMERFQMAINPLERAAQLSRETGNRRQQAAILNNLGNIYDSLNQDHEAERSFRDALGIFQSLKLDDSVRATQAALDRVLAKGRSK